MGKGKGGFRYVVVRGRNALWGPLGCSPFSPPLIRPRVKAVYASPTFFINFIVMHLCLVVQTQIILDTYLFEI